MKNKIRIRILLLRIMYIYTIITAGLIGFTIVFFQDFIKSFININPDIFNFGIIGSVYLSFALLSILGILQPIKFVPILLLQFTYKIIWIIFIIIPSIINKNITPYAINSAIVFLSYILGDIFAIPFLYLFKFKNEIILEKDN